MCDFAHGQSDSIEQVTQYLHPGFENRHYVIGIFINWESFHPINTNLQD